MKKRVIVIPLFLVWGIFSVGGLFAQNMNRYIALDVKDGEQIQLKFVADAPNTPVKIVSGGQVYDITVNAGWTMFENYTTDANTLEIYGNVKGFDCRDNTNKITGVDASKNPQLKYLYCFNNAIANIDVSNCSVLTLIHCSNNLLNHLNISDCVALKNLYCLNNNFSTQAFDELFCALPNRIGQEQGFLFPVSSNNSEACDIIMASNKQNAIDKNWAVKYTMSGNAVDIPPTTGTYSCTTNVLEVIQSDINVYPNPVNKILYIETDANNFNAELYNVCGKLVLHERNHKNISVTDLPSGVYLLKLTTEKGVYSRRIVKN